MKRAIIVVLLAVTVFTTMACGSKTGTLRVKVMASDAGILTGAKVVSNSQPEGQLKITGLTDTEGFVTFNNIKAGRYEFTVSCAGYLQRDFSVGMVSGNREVTIVMERQ